MPDMAQFISIGYYVQMMFAL